ncbi:carbohydrate-selective porin B [Acetobacter nitrogenifigens DSM 23921 = NBRC 105050]|nr:carbohydrate porin [Acetobacter nitrogenifigens]GBQ98475.1 carbohydrate-selective porin B [Acetobacter nitrogenifigens DSM 23921 = NBRC 105050]
MTGSDREGPTEMLMYGNPHLFGDWGGIQPWLTKRGIYLTAGINEEFMGNVTGGKQRAYSDAGQVAAELDIDWDKLAGINEFWTHMLVVNGHGNNLGRLIGENIAQPQQIYGARGNVVAHLVALYGEKGLFRNRLNIAAGWIPTGTFFNYDYLACSFVNVTTCGNPAPGKYVPGGRDWPSGNLGAVVRVWPTRQFYLMAGLFAVNSSSNYNGGISGWAWAQPGLGKFSSQFEVGWLPSFGKNDLIGHYKLGYFYDNARYPHLYEDINGNSYQATGLPRRYRAGMNVAWFLADQMLVRYGKGLTNGLIAFGGAEYANGATVAMRDHAWISLLSAGTPWHRPLDQVGIMYHHFDMSHSVALQQESSQALGLPYVSNQWGEPYGVQGHENVWEAFYSVHVLTGTSIQPDFQYINHVNATTKFRDAAILGVQINTIL